MGSELFEPFAMFEKLLIASNKLMGSLVDNIAELSVRVRAVEDKLDYRKQAREEQFIPPVKPTIPSIIPNRGED